MNQRFIHIGSSFSLIVTYGYCFFRNTNKVWAFMTFLVWRFWNTRERKNENQLTPVDMYVSRILWNTVVNTCYRRSSLQSLPLSLEYCHRPLLSVLPQTPSKRIFQILRQVKAYCSPQCRATLFSGQQCKDKEFWRYCHHRELIIFGFFCVFAHSAGMVA